MTCVTEVDSGDNLSEVAPGILLLHPAMWHEVVEELAAHRVLHDKKNLLWCVNDLVQPRDVWMVQRLHDPHLTHKLLYGCGWNLLKGERRGDNGVNKGATKKKKLKSSKIKEHLCLVHDFNGNLERKKEERKKKKESRIRDHFKVTPKKAKQGTDKGFTHLRAGQLVRRRLYLGEIALTYVIQNRTFQKEIGMRYGADRARWFFSSFFLFLPIDFSKS